MEEQLKTESQTSEPKEEKKFSETLKMIFKILIGIVLIALGIWAVVGWWKSLLIVFKGCIGLFLILVGLIFLAIARE
ncbi:MAG: hypothetical protein NC925_01670 [Candidatus Omnitrophica bacterium]|nr:hypothetical protein [Candidatus Omnitrophota bacterium]MCM8832041.1 hypothetical protein [Candidatus Omnitrophota bacterium]